MSERYEVSFKNKEIKMKGWIMGSAFLIAILIQLIVGYKPIINIIFIASIVIYYIWYFLYSKNKRRNDRTEIQ